MGYTKSRTEVDPIIMAYATWGKFIEMSAGIIPWGSVVDVFEPEVKDVENDEHVKEVTLRIRYREEDETE